MDIKNLQRNKELKKVRISIKATESNRKFLKKYLISPQKLFDNALKEVKKQIK